MTVNEIIKSFPAVLTDSVPGNIRKVIQYKIADPVYVVLDHGACSVHDGLATDYDVAISIKDEHLLAMFKGKLSGPMAYMTGKLKVEGDVMFAQKVPSFFDLEKIV